MSTECEHGHLARQCQLCDCVAEIANLRKCITATEGQRDEAIEAHASACARANDMQVENVKQRDELAKLREQRDRLLLKRYAENVNALQYGMSMVDAQRIVDAEIAEEFSVRIIDGKVEEIGNG